MPAATILAPYQQNAMQGSIGLPYFFGAIQIMLEIQDALDVAGLGVVPLLGDAAGRGSDTIRVTDLGQVGWTLPMQALFGETDTVAPSSIILGYEQVTVGMFGLSQASTYTAEIQGREDAVKLDSLKARVPQSWGRTFRDNVCLVGSGFTNFVGSAATTLSVDDHLDLLTEYRTVLGSTKPLAMVDGVQFDQLVRSYRNEPAFQNSSEAFARMLGLSVDASQMLMQRHPNVGGLGIDFALTDSIVQSGGARQGFAFPAGGIGWGVNSTAGLKTANPQGTILVPALGLCIEELTGGTAQTTRQYRATAWMGFTEGSPRVFINRRFISAI
jgi:hypothetical protein